MLSLTTPNPTLKGHKLLIIQPWSPVPKWIAHIKQSYPDLEIRQFCLKNLNDTQLPPDFTLDEWKDATMLVTYQIFPTPDMAPKLEYLQLNSAGCNHVLNHPIYTQQKEVVLCTANGVHPPQIAEWVIATFLAHQHHLPQYLNFQKNSDWIPPETDEDVEDAVGLRMGILGYGCIGRQCAYLAKALGMDVYAFTNRERPDAESRIDDAYVEPGLGDPQGIIPSKWFHGTTPSAVNDFLAQNLDVVVLAMPLTKVTKHMIAKPQFEIMSRKKTFLSNIGRGGLVNTDDLMDALDRGLIRGAALDVTDPEPLPKDHPLWKKQNLIITPHVSGGSVHHDKRFRGILEYNLKRISEGIEPVNKVDKALGY